jgi:hypothetical protein
VELQLRDLFEGREDLREKLRRKEGSRGLKDLSRLKVVKTRERGVFAEGDAARVVEADEKRAAEEIVAEHCELEVFDKLSVDRGGYFGHGDEDGEVLTLLLLVHPEENLLDGQVTENGSVHGVREETLTDLVNQSWTRCWQKMEVEFV